MSHLEHLGLLLGEKKTDGGLQAKEWHENALKEDEG